LGRVEIYCVRVRAITTMALYDTVGGLPNAQISPTIYPMFPGTDSGSYSWKSFMFYDTPIQSGVMYALVLQDVDLWVAQRNNPYGSGLPYYWVTDHWEVDWTWYNDDYCFRTYKEAVNIVEIEKELELMPDEPEFYLEINSMVDFELELINEEEP